MQEWKIKAIEILPEIKTEILDSDEPMQLWLEIVYYFDMAYEEEPRNESFIKRVYDYQDWCLEQDEEGKTAAEHLPTCVITCFWEHIPTKPFARQDMPNWFTLEDVLANQHFFRYSLSDENFKELIDLYTR